MQAVKMLSESGAVAGRLAGYELRPQQLAMAGAVAEAFEAGEHLLVEAGTGVGKSFAYLVPAIERIATKGGRVVVSTHTIALQEQLITKDIPFLKKALPYEFKAELVKGRSNYLGLRRLARASERSENLFNLSQRSELWEIEEWAYRTRDGSRSDLSLQPDPAVWDLIKSERNDCMARRCPHYEACFYQRARRRAADAQLLVVNHAMLFSDLALRQGGASILPDFDYVILDEAHTVEQVAGDHLGASVSDAQVRFLLNGLYNDRTERGILTRSGGKAAVPAVQAAREAAKAYFGELALFKEKTPRQNGRLLEPPPIHQRVSSALVSLGETLQKVRGDLTDEQDRFELASMVERCTELAATVDDLHSQKIDGCVYWLETRGSRRRQVTLHSRPINVGPALKDALFDPINSVILTSATLSTATDPPFEYIQSRLGLDRIREKVLGSPFDYRKQVTIYIEADMPDPSNAAAFTSAAAETMKGYLLKSRGRAFVLFTSYDMMNRCAELLDGFFREHDLSLLVQGANLPRSKMLERFRKNERCVLFGTDTFWSGVDVPGEALSNVIIVKLPFAVPNHPVTEARIEQIREQGGNPFMDFQIPEAVLKFKQGFGRLIRSRSDRGMVVILDPRVRTKPYGRRFLNALPECKVVVESSRNKNVESSG